MAPLQFLGVLLVLPLFAEARPASLESRPDAPQTVGLATAAVIGCVTDSTGAVLPDVTVTISGDTLMGTRTVKTNVEGLYRFTALPPGEYTIVFTLQDFAVFTRVVAAGAGFTATVDEVLSVKPLEDSMTVDARRPVVDRHSTTIGYSFGAAELESLPNSRSTFAILTDTPAVQVARIEVGGGSGAAGAPYSAYGIAGSNRPMLEGIHIAGMFPAGFSLDYGSFSEVVVGTAAHGPEWQDAGVQMRFISKSGGNEYRGSLYADCEREAWQAFNIDGDQIDRGANGTDWLPARETNRVSTYHDINADVGGYIRPDTHWWYASFREQDVSQRQVNFPVKPLRTRLTNYTGKTTHRLARGHTLVAYGHVNRNHQPNKLDAFALQRGSLGAATALHESESSTTDQVGLGWVWKGEWNAVISDRLLFETRAGQFGSNRRERPYGSEPRFEDVEGLLVTGGGRDAQQSTNRQQWTASLSHFKDGRLGQHHFKAGGEIVRSVETEIWNHGHPGDVVHVLRADAPAGVYLLETPSKSENGLMILSAHVSDAWRVTNRLTITPGLRFDRTRLFLPAQAHPVGRFNTTPISFAAVDPVIAWTVAAPRAGLALDLAGDGSAVLEASYGFYASPGGANLAASANPNAPVWWRQHPWNDLNGNREWEPGEEGAREASRGGVASESLDPRLRPTVVHEGTAWLEHEMSSNVGLRTGVVWRSQRQPFARQIVGRPFDAFTEPVSVVDPGPDLLPGTPDDGRAIMGFGLNPDLVDVPPVHVVRNVPDAHNDSWSWDVVASRRFSQRWSFLAGFSHTWTRQHASGYSGQSVRQNQFPLTPNDLINTDAQGRHAFRVWSAKVHGTFEGPWRLRVTPLLRHQSGQPFGRTFVQRFNYGNVRILAEPIGTRSMDHITILDVRIEKRFPLAAKRTLAAFVDVFNVLNANPELHANWTSGTDFLRPLDIVPPRIARIGLKLTW